VTVKLSAAAVDVAANAATASLIVTTTGPAPPRPGFVEVRGRDTTTGKSNILCLALTERRTGTVSVVSALRKDKPPTKNIEIILDASGSMRALLGKQTRWATAQAVLKDVVAKLPKDFSVGLRAYGHTLPSTNPGTCKDTALVVPVGPLNPTSLLAAAGKLAPRGETPLVYSILQTPADLKSVGGGTVILITDGEESCKGDFAAAAKTLKDAGMNLTLNIVGFTLTGETAVAELGALAGSTGGRYYSAQDGEQLSRAVKLAALNRLPYDIFDAAGNLLVSGQTSELSRELPPGKYRIRIDALGQVLEDSLTIVPDQTTSLSLGVEGDRFVIRR